MDQEEELWECRLIKTREVVGCLLFVSGGAIVTDGPGGGAGLMKSVETLLSTTDKVCYNLTCFSFTSICCSTKSSFLSMDRVILCSRSDTAEEAPSMISVTLEIIIMRYISTNTLHHSTPTRTRCLDWRCGP